MIAACLIALAPHSAFADDRPQFTWAEIARIADAKYARTVFVAREGVLLDGFAKYWGRMVYAAPQSIGVYDNALIAPENSKGQTQFIEMWTLHLMDCNKHTVATSRAVFYDTEGKIVSRGFMNQAPAPFEPKSLQSLAADVVCH